MVLARIAGNLFNKFDENEINYEIRKVMELGLVKG